MKRREFLNFSAQSLAFLGVSSTPWLAHAEALFATQQQGPRFLVFITIEGGWDISLSTDPWVLDQRPEPEDHFIEFRSDEILGDGDFKVGPAMVSLKKFFPDMALVNGVIAGQTDNGHEAHRLYMKSGSGSGSIPEFTVSLDKIKGDSKMGVLAQESQIYMANFQSATTQTATLEYLSSGSEFKAYSQRLSPVERAKANLLKNGPEISKMTKRIQDLKVSMASSLANDSYFLNKSLGMAVAFELGLARVCSLKLSPKNGSLDTHGSHEGAHLTALSSAFERLESLFSLFKNIPFGTTGSSLFDQTTFVLTSEFSRTPALNASLGKDHNPQTNSVLFAGAGIKGLQKAGASRLVTRQEAQSTPYMVGVPYDFELKKALASPEGASSYIRPENCIVTLEKIFGVPKSWSVLQSKGFREVSAILA